METKWITHRNVEMKYIFKKLFYNSIDMAAKFTTMKSKMDMDDALKSDVLKTMQNWSNIGGKPKSDSKKELPKMNASNEVSDLDVG